MGERSPGTIVVENVLGLLTSNGGADFRAMLVAMIDAGYDAGAVVLDAADFVPQSRQRVFVIATRGRPTPLLADPDERLHPPALRKAVQGLPHLWRNLPQPPGRNITLRDVLEPVPGSTELAGCILELMTESHRAKVAASARERRPEEVVVGAVNRRMRDGVQRAEIRFDGLAQALRTGSGGSSIQTLLILDDAGAHARKITPREAARLMGLPDAYRLPSNVGDAHTLVGDGVVVPVVKYVAEECRK